MKTILLIFGSHQKFRVWPFNQQFATFLVGYKNFQEGQCLSTFYSFWINNNFITDLSPFNISERTKIEMVQENYLSPHVAWISTETLGTPAFLWVRSPQVDTLSISVAESPPWRPPMGLVCSSAIFNSATHRPSSADTIFN